MENGNTVFEAMVFLSNDDGFATTVFVPAGRRHPGRPAGYVSIIRHASRDL